jgi:hypothetical protein
MTYGVFSTQQNDVEVKTGGVSYASMKSWRENIKKT